MSVGLYLDTSALMKLWLYESTSEEVHRAFEDAARVVSCAIARLEARATLARVVRERRLAVAHLPVVESKVAHDLDLMTFLGVDDYLITAAGALAFRHQLKSLDALHLGAALLLPHTFPDVPWVFMTFDLKLGRAAALEGLTVWPDADAQP